MGDLAALLCSCSYHAEKLLRRRGYLCGVIWLVETASGRREMFETQVDASAPSDASNKVLLSRLIVEMQADFAGSGVVAFACAYSADRITTNRATQARFHSDVVIVESHDSTGSHICIEREIVTAPSGRVSLRAAAAPEPADRSVYASILEPAVRLQPAS